MHLIPNIASDGNLHRDELGVVARVDDFAELAEAADFAGEFGEVVERVFGGVF